MPRFIRCRTNDLGDGIGALTEVANQVAREDYFLSGLDYVISNQDVLFNRYLSDLARSSTLRHPGVAVTDILHNQFFDHR